MTHRNSERPTAPRRSPLRAVLVALALILGGTAAAEEQVRWQMNSLLHPTHFGEAGQRFADTVRTLSDGSIDITYRDRLVLGQNSFAAMDSGVIDAVWGSAGHHHREDPALTLFTGIPFGPGPAAFTLWMREGGGQAALDAIYARHGLKSVFCGILPSETGGWFRSEIATPADLDGLRIRTFGYGARTLRRLGVVPYELPAGEIATAFASGLIDAAEFSLPSIDAELGLAGAAPHLYFPGWQQPVTSLEFLLPAAKYDALSDHQKAVIAAACGDSLTWTMTTATMAQIATLDRLRAEGVQIRDFPEPVLDAIRAEWEEVIAEDVADDPLLAAAWDSYLSFRDAYGDWTGRAYAD
jgi:TRAP-type mannitol/chloroaromatic compound transport system substrate-binding protein